MAVSLSFFTIFAPEMRTNAHKPLLNMAENNAKQATEAQQTRAYAGYYGLWVGACWVACFGFSMAGLSQPLLGNLGLLTGLASFPLAVWLFRGFRDHVAPLPLRRAWHLSWMTFMAAALLCTAAQYIYFAYIDGGHLMRAYTAMLQQPEVVDMLRQLMPGEDVETMTNQALEAFATTPPSQLAIQFLFWNALLATIVALPTALMSKGKVRNEK